MHLNYHDYSGVILDESQSGKTINVQRGFEVDRNKASQKDETEINSGDSSSIQKSRHSSSFSSSSSASSSAATETRRIHLNPTGEKPEVLTTTYTHNTSGTSTIGTSDLSGNRGVIFHAESGGGYGSTTLGGGFREEDESFGSRLPDLEEPYGSRANHSVGTEDRWDESGQVQGGHAISSHGRVDSVLTESERRYQELVRQQEETRLREEEESRQRKLEEEAHLVQRQREEQERLLALQRHRQEQEQRRQEEERRREKEEEEQQRRRHEDEEQRRVEEERRWQEEREHRRYEEERRYGLSTDDHQWTTESDLVTGDREETHGGRVVDLGSTQELERLFSSLSKDATSYRVYNRQGQQYVQFKARFRTSADRKEYIEFQDGTMFPLKDRYGEQSYVSESASERRDSRFLRIEGQLLVAADNKAYMVLKDGRKFSLPDSFSYTEERTYTLRGPHDSHRQESNVDSQGQSRSYDRSWHEGSSSSGTTLDGGGYETRYDTRVREEKRTEERTSSSRVYGRDYDPYDRFKDEPAIDSDSDPNLLNSRHRRENDVLDVEEFKKLERYHRRHRRDLDDESLTNEASFLNDDYYENDPTSLADQVQPCDAAKCVMLRCVLGPLKKDQEVWIGARYRVDARTLKEVAFKEKVKVSTKLVARVTKQPFIGTPAEQVIRSNEIITNVEPSAPPSAPDIIPVWVVVLSACAGIIILLLLIYLLHKASLLARITLRSFYFILSPFALDVARYRVSRVKTKISLFHSVVSSRGTDRPTRQRDNR